MNYIGISAGSRDAALSVVNNNGDILFAGYSDRYSKVKHDPNLCMGIIDDAHHYIDSDFEVHYYERPFVRALSRFITGQEIGPVRAKNIIGAPLNRLNYYVGKKQIGPVFTHKHHLCHAAAGFQTSPFEHATVVIIDTLGELDTISIWDARYDAQGFAVYKKLWGKKYPNSIGSFYSTIAKHAGLKQHEEEWICMGMVVFGLPRYAHDISLRFVKDRYKIEFTKALHKDIPQDFLLDAKDVDVAASSQFVTEMMIQNVMGKAALLGKSKNLVYGGDVAFNSLANRNIGLNFNKVWIIPDPGDAGNSLGAAALGYGKKLNWQNAFLGHNIFGEYPVNALLHNLTNKKIVGVASGRTEFGPRALGNRSILADPRDNNVKNMINDIKHRSKFKSFSPVILEEMVNQHFIMPKNWKKSPYIHTNAICRNPENYPAIVHVDCTSRVQTVPNDDSGIRKLLEAWYEKTKCPMLLNTSLNIFGEPMVNDLDGAMKFEKLYNIKVCS